MARLYRLKIRAFLLKFRRGVISFVSCTVLQLYRHGGKQRGAVVSSYPTVFIGHTFILNPGICNFMLASVTLM